MTDEPMISVRREISRRPGAAVAEGIFRGERVAIKTFSSHQGFSRERGALSAMASAGAPVPRLLWAGPYQDSHVLIQSWVHGTPGPLAYRTAQGEDRAKLVDLTAATHASMCRASLAAPGLEVSFVQVATGGAGDAEWPQLLEAQVGKWLSRISSETLEILGGSEQMSRLLAQARTAPADLRTIIHCDYLFRNLIVRSPQAAVIIDFGTALIGDPRYDLAKLIWCDLDGSGGELSTRFVRTWSEAMGLEVPRDLLSLYICCHGLAAVAWVEKQPSVTAADTSFRKLALETFDATLKPWR